MTEYFGRLTHLHWDCWSDILHFLNSADIRAVYATNVYLQKKVMQLRRQYAVFSLEESENEENTTNSHLQASTNLPRHIQLLKCPKLEWSRKWSQCLGFYNAALFLSHMTEEQQETKYDGSSQGRLRDAAGWDCHRPLHVVETTILKELHRRFNAVTKLKIIDKRSVWTFWDSLSLHPQITEHIFTQCKAITNLHVEHFCLTSKFSFQKFLDLHHEHSQKKFPKIVENKEDDDALMFLYRSYDLERWKLPELRGLHLLDTTLDQPLMVLIEFCMPNLEILHVNKVDESVTSRDFSHFLEALPQLRQINIGYSFYRGKRECREVCCKSCQKGRQNMLEARAAPCSAKPKKISLLDICIRHNIKESSCDALLEACGSSRLRSLHLFGLESDGQRDDDEVSALDHIILKSLSKDNGETLRRLHFGPRVSLTSRHITALCHHCHNLEQLVIKASITKPRLALISSKLQQLKILSFKMQSANDTISDEIFGLLHNLQKLEILHLHLAGGSHSLAWYNLHLGTFVGMAGREEKIVSQSQQNLGITNEGIIGLQNCRSLREVWFGNKAFAGESDETPQQACNDFCDNDEPLLSFAEWIWNHRRTGIDMLRTEFSKRRNIGNV